MSPYLVSPVRKPWWTGARGEWYVVAQLALMALVFFGPRRLAGWPAQPFPFAQACATAGAVLMVAGGVLMIAAIVQLRRSLTPLPYPRDNAEMVETGVYGLVRHPMYGGGLVLALGWALFVQSWLTIGYVAALFAFIEVKARREEQWLEEKFPRYAAYQRRVRMLIPFIY